MRDLSLKGTSGIVAYKSLDASTSGYHAWCGRQVKTEQKYHDLKTVYCQHHARLGAPSVVYDIRDFGYSMSERTVGRMLKHFGLRSKISRKYKHTID